MSIPDTYTGKSMTLMCEPPGIIKLGKITISEWNFKGMKIKDSVRREITTSNSGSQLKINNVIPADSGK